MKTKVGILMGGTSSEYEVSLSSGMAVFENINKCNYDVTKLLIEQNGEFQFQINDLKNQDIIFICLHGSGGEDGSIQGYLETLGVKYTGPGIFTSSLCVDKYTVKNFLAKNDISVVNAIKVSSIKDCMQYPFPFVLKPNLGGSSIGVHIIKNEKELSDGFNDAKQYGEIVLEPYIKGREITVGVIGSGENIAVLPIVEIISKNEFFDYEAKYEVGKAEEIIPANLSKTLEREIKEIAIKTYKLIQAKDFSRIDMFITESNEILVSEINTIPGLTHNSLLPKSAMTMGISFENLIDKIIQYNFNDD